MNEKLLHDHEQKVCYQGNPNLYLDGIGALPIEVSQWEVLLQLLEKVMRSYA